MFEVQATIFSNPMTETLFWAIIIDQSLIAGDNVHGKIPDLLKPLGSEQHSGTMALLVCVRAGSWTMGGSFLKGWGAKKTFLQKSSTILVLIFKIYPFT